jgi:hypothetical protein
MNIIERLKELHSKATAGPWRIPEAFGVQFSRIEGTERVCENFGDLSLPGPRANAELITLLRNNLPTLLEVVEMLEMVFSKVDKEGGLYWSSLEELSNWVNIKNRGQRALAKLEADDET